MLVTRIWKKNCICNIYFFPYFWFMERCIVINNNLIKITFLNVFLSVKYIQSIIYSVKRLVSTFLKHVRVVYKKIINIKFLLKLINTNNLLINNWFFLYAFFRLLLLICFLDSERSEKYVMVLLYNVFHLFIFSCKYFLFS